MRLAIWCSVGLWLGGVVVSAQETRPAATEASAVVPKLTCPVSGKPADRKVAMRFRDRWVYCATAADLEKLKADPLEYADGITAQWEADPLLRLQVKCPVTGEQPATDIFEGAGEEAIFFATVEARARWVKDRKPFEAKLEECFTFQTRCPVSDLPVDPAARRVVDGQVILFRCPHCAGEFDKAGADERDKILRKAVAIGSLNEKQWRQRQSQSAKEPSPEPVAKEGQAPAGR
ncbi:MAG: hypothetical protein IPM18_04105 [Phycisphaerales bacterium]|nr:hypothetical protein [Phycisphaerales bacterium]